jgi:hypothetical protein
MRAASAQRGLRAIAAISRLGPSAAERGGMCCAFPPYYLHTRLSRLSAGDAEELGSSAAEDGDLVVAEPGFDMM